MARALAVTLMAMFPLPAFAAEALATGPGATSARAEVRFAIKVPRVLRMEELDHPSEVTVLDQDVARGEVVVRGPSLRFVSNNRSGHVLRARLHGNSFSGLEIVGLPALLAFDGASGATAMSARPGAGATGAYRIEYRLRLAPGARAGRYAWPVALELQNP
jgi:hypothetical protein